MNAQSLPSSDLSSANWEQLRQMAEAETGMDLAGTRFPRLQEAVRKLLPAQSSSAELQRVMSQPDTRSRFLERLTVQLTIGESFFFRNEHHFRTLRETVIPAIVRDNADKRELRVWTAGCATGEEPYSMAILLDQILGSQTNWQVSILGTDLNPEFVERARQARYRQWSFRQTKIHQDRNYFTPEGDLFCLVPRVRNHVRFAYLNLVKDVYPSPLTGTLGLDLILFRNVAIYLKPEVTQAILQRFYQALRPGGWLLLGETELTQIPTQGFEARRFDQATFYQKGADRPSTIQPLSPMTMPVLATMLPSGGATISTVPTLPDWVPLPTPRNRRPDRQQTGTAAARSALDVTTNRETSTWDRIERCLSHRDFAEAERIIDRIPALSDRAAMRLRYLRQLLASAEIARARQMLDVCLKEEPMQIEVQLLNASFAEEAGDLGAAEQAYRRALYVDRNCPIAHFHLALVLQQKSDTAGAERSLRTALRLTETMAPHALVEYGEGVCHGRLKEMIALLISKS